MSNDNGKVIDLRSLQNAIAGKVELNEGVHDVRRFNAEQYQAALTLSADPQQAIERTVRLVLECAPTIPEAIARKLNPEALTLIITLASQGIDAVEKLFPNAAGPGPSTSPG